MASKRYDRELSPDFGTGLVEKRAKHCNGHVLKKRDLGATGDLLKPLESQSRVIEKESERLKSEGDYNKVKFHIKCMKRDSEVSSYETSHDFDSFNNEEGATKSAAPLFISTRSFTGESRAEKFLKNSFSREQKEKHVTENSGLSSPSKVVKDKSFRAHAGHRVQVIPSSTEIPSDKHEAVSAPSGSSLLSRLIAQRSIQANEIARYLRRKDGSVMKEGRLTQQGVLCCCCDELFTLSGFEAHAGSKLHRPAANMFLSDGRSLAECQNERVLPQCTPKTSEPSQLKENIKKCPKQARHRASKEEVDIVREGDIICSICANGGKLVCCDGCPSTFHLECLELKELPEGNWFCYRCKCAVCGTLEDERVGMLNTLRLCDQCDRHYHVSCCESRQVGQNWFCQERCEKVFIGLQSLSNKESNALDEGLSWSLIRFSDKNRPKGDTGTSLSLKLSNALNVLKECFHPIVDVVTKKDIMSNVVYSRRSVLNRLDFHGFYTFILERDKQIVCVATVRLHGATLAEMPFIGTPFRYRRQGMCRVLVHAIEKVLCSLEVDRLILQALPGVEDTWINSFNFRIMNDAMKYELRYCNLFPMSGVKLLHKSLLGSSYSTNSTSSESSLMEYTSPEF